MLVILGSLDRFIRDYQKYINFYIDAEYPKAVPSRVHTIKIIYVIQIIRLAMSVCYYHHQYCSKSSRDRIFNTKPSYYFRISATYM